MSPHTDAGALLPCPFCGSSSVDPEGWMSCESDGSDKRTGPACDDCGASATSDERWNTRDWAPEADNTRQAASHGSAGGEPVRQYYYRANECKADHAYSPDCICWHDEGTGPLASNALGKGSDWRVKPPQSAPVAQEAKHCGVWQQISTAPKDGTEIIGMFHRQYDETSPPTIYGPWTVAWDGRKWRSSWDEQEVISYMSDFGTEYKGPDIDPTHWQPLPDTSSVPSAEGKSHD